MTSWFGVAGSASADVRVTDDAITLKGPFDLKDAPKGRRNPGATQVSYDHWNTIFTPDLSGGKVRNKAAILQREDGAGDGTNPMEPTLPPNRNQHLESMIGNFRKMFGEGKWKEAKQKELENAKKVLGSNNLVWEDLTPWTKGAGDSKGDAAAASSTNTHRWAGKEKWEEF